MEPRRTGQRRPYAPRVPIDQRREQLLDAALRVIDRDGYGRLTIDAIARQAGVTRPVVYGAFESGLPELLGALLDRQQERALTALLSRLPSAQVQGSGELRRAARDLHQMVVDDPMTWRIILDPPGNLPDVVRERVEADREQVRVLAEQLVGDTPDPELASHALMATLEELGRLILRDPARFTADRMAATVGALLPRLGVQGV